MDLAKSHEFFQPEMCEDRLHIIGCGATGSTLAENLVRLGLKNLTLYDFDTVEPHNIANQIYRHSDIGTPKVEALSKLLTEINPEIVGNIKTIRTGYSSQPLSGYIFLCIDTIDLRRDIVKRCEGNEHIKAVFDFRIRLTDAQHYAADWRDRDMVRNLLNSMNFTHEEALAETPVSLCNIPLSVAPTVRVIAALGVTNFMNFVKHGSLKKLIEIDVFRFNLSAF